MTGDGRLHICGSCHKGLGADHLFKVMTSGGDHLLPYAVGGAARDAAVPSKPSSGCWTGALERRGLSTREMLADCGIDDQRDKDSKEGVASLSVGEVLLPKKETRKPDEDIETRYLSSVNVIKTAVASIHSFCLGADGSLFAWGCGSVNLIEKGQNP